jgi:hypothetical protein
MTRLTIQWADEDKEAFEERYSLGAFDQAV